MNKNIWLWELVGFSVTSLGGTLLHFIYEWTGESLLAAPFSGVNESTWEHMKLLFWPMFVFAILQSFFFRDRDDFWLVKLKGIAAGLLLIPIIFYVYNGVIGKSPDFINIAIFFVAAAISYLLETLLFNRGSTYIQRKSLPLVILILIAALFVIFSFATPQIAIFEDPLTGSYGI